MGTVGLQICRPYGPQDHRRSYISATNKRYRYVDIVPGSLFTDAGLMRLTGGPREHRRLRGWRPDGPMAGYCARLAVQPSIAQPAVDIVPGSLFTGRPPLGAARAIERRRSIGGHRPGRKSRSDMPLLTELDGTGGPPGYRDAGPTGLRTIVDFTSAHPINR